MSETSSAALFRWDDTRYAASHALRSCLRSIPPGEEWNQVQLLTPSLDRTLRTWSRSQYPLPPNPLPPRSAANGCSYLAKSWLLMGPLLVPRGPASYACTASHASRSPVPHIQTAS